MCSSFITSCKPLKYRQYRHKASLKPLKNIRSAFTHACLQHVTYYKEAFEEAI